ncbi:MAG: type II toxin-antitoxin system HicA family toxin [Acidobacteria bacterium]|nr:type II toxin-antitoxin system HicA family toxin [Acidobacteriota bacterium]
MDYDELRAKALAGQGCTFGMQSGSHLKVYLGQKQSILPIHGSRHQLGTGLVNKIKKDLGLK